jgi:hypothetical protein
MNNIDWPTWDTSVWIWASVCVQSVADWQYGTMSRTIVAP